MLLSANLPALSPLFSRTRIDWIRHQHLDVAALALLSVLPLPSLALVHAKGLYKTQADSIHRARELGRPAMPISLSNRSLPVRLTADQLDPSTGTSVPPSFRHPW